MGDHVTGDDWRNQLADLREQLTGERQPQARLTREQARRYRCPDCQAPAGWLCRKTREGRNVASNRCCPGRYDAARQAGEQPPTPPDSPTT